MIQYLELMRLAYEIAIVQSDDPSTQNAALIVSQNGVVLAAAANRFPLGVEKRPVRFERPLKYSFMGHAEARAICQAAAIGRATAGCAMIVPWAACSACAIAIIEAGISTVVSHRDMMDKAHLTWKSQIEIGDTMLAEAGVSRVYVSGKIGAGEALFNCERWSP